MEIKSCYDIAVLVLGTLPSEFAFFYPILAFIIALLLITIVVAFFALPFHFFKR